VMAQTLIEKRPQLGPLDVLPGLALAILLHAAFNFYPQQIVLSTVASFIVLPMILVGLLAWRRSAIGLIATLIVVVVAAAANVLAFSRGIWLSAALPIFAAAPPAVGTRSAVAAPTGCVGCCVFGCGASGGFAV